MTLLDICEPCPLPPLAWLCSPYTYELKDKRFHGFEYRLVRWLTSGTYCWWSEAVAGTPHIYTSRTDDAGVTHTVDSLVYCDQIEGSDIHRRAMLEIMRFHELIGRDLADLSHSAQPHVWAALQGKRGFTDAMTYVGSLLFQGVQPGDLLNNVSPRPLRPKERAQRAIKPLPV